MKKFTFAAVAAAMTCMLMPVNAEKISVTLGESQSLADALPENSMAIDSLIVAGNVNAADFSTMWDMSFNGALGYIDLSKAVLADNKVPDFAFYNHNEQNHGPYVTTTRLKEILLPESVVEIGACAFRFVNLNKFSFPKELRKIGDIAFDHSRTNWGDMKFNDKLEEIGQEAFFTDPNITSITFPASLRKIGRLCFYMNQAKTITFEEGVESIGEFAFGGNQQIENLELPNSLKSMGMSCFEALFNLKTLKLSTSLTSIPEVCFRDAAITELVVPGNIEEIGVSAFETCQDLKTLTMEEGVKRVLTNGFYKSGLVEIHFPASLEYLALNSFSGLQNLKEVYSPAPVPPACEVDDLVNAAPGPFGDSMQYVPTTAILYVPKGCVAAYKDARGWEYFKDVREYDFSGVKDVELSSFLKISSGEQKITIESAADTQFVVYGINGICIASGEAKADTPVSISLPAGIYTVCAEKKAYKVKVN